MFCIRSPWCCPFCWCGASPCPRACCPIEVQSEFRCFWPIALAQAPKFVMRFCKESCRNPRVGRPVPPRVPFVFLRMGEEDRRTQMPSMWLHCRKRYVLGFLSPYSLPCTQALFCSSSRERGSSCLQRTSVSTGGKNSPSPNPISHTPRVGVGKKA